MIRRLTVMIIIFALLSGMLGGLFFFLLGQEQPKKPESLVFSQREPTNIERIDVKNTEGAYTISYDSVNGGYVIGDVPADLVDMDLFIRMMVDCSTVTASSRLEKGQAGLPAYGLDSPQAECRIAYDDGTQLTLNIGHREPVTGDYYLQVDGRPGLYTFGKEAAETLLRGQKGFVSRLVTPKLEVSSPLSAVRDAWFSGKALDAPLEIRAVMGGEEQVRRDALSFGAATHLVRGMGLHELDQAGGILILGSLLGIEANSVESYNLSEEQMSAYGFSDPDMRAEFVISGGQEGKQRITLSLVKTSEDRFFAAVEGRGVVYLVNRPAFYDIRYQDLIMRYFISPMLMDIKGMTVETPEAVLEITYTKTEDKQTVVMVNGQAADPELFMSFYRLATSASADGDLRAGILPQGTPALIIRYHYKTSDKPDDVLRFFPGTPRRMDVEVNGVIELDIRESFVTRMTEACVNLTKGLKIEEVW